MAYKYNPFTGTLDRVGVSAGGSGISGTLTANGAVYATGVSTITSTAALTDGQLLIGDTGSNPVAGTLTQPASGITITNGAGSITFALADDLAGLEGLTGTGVVTRTSANSYATSSIANNQVLIGDSGNVVQQVGLSNGELLIGDTGGTPVGATLTAGAGISITNGAGSITVASSGGGLSWTEVTGTSQSMAVGNGYIANNAAQVTLTLPASAAVGDVVRVAGKGAGGWKIAQNASQTIRILGSTTTSGVTGQIVPDEDIAAIELVCTTANNQWTAISMMGNYTVT